MMHHDRERTTWRPTGRGGDGTQVGKAKLTHRGARTAQRRREQICQQVSDESQGMPMWLVVHGVTSPLVVTG